MVIIIDASERALYSPVHFKLKQILGDRMLIIIDVLYTWDIGRAKEIASVQKFFHPDHEIIIDGIGWRNAGETPHYSEGMGWIDWKALEEMDDCCQPDKYEYLVTKVSKGCPKNCPYCHSGPHEFVQIPKVNRNIVKLVDENLLACRNTEELLNALGKIKHEGKNVYWECVAGIDKDFLSARIALALKDNHFTNIKISWDGSFSDWPKVKVAIDLLEGAGFRKRDLKVFVISNWQRPFEENIEKLKALFYERVQIEDCWFKEKDFWTQYQREVFRHCCRRANMIVRMGCKDLNSLISYGVDSGKHYPKDPEFRKLIEGFISGDQLLTEHGLP